MKVLKSQYFACGPQGYIKIKENDFKQTMNKKQLPVSSRCHQILPISESKYQQDIAEETATKKVDIKLPIQLIQKNLSQTNDLFLNQTTNCEKIMQKQQVYSIHMDETKSTSKKKINSARDLTQSSFTNINKHKDQMKRSMNFFQTTTTAPSIQQNQNIDRLNKFQNQLKQQKNYRKSLEEKYNILINYVQTNQKLKTQKSYVQEDQLSLSMQDSIYNNQKKGKKQKAKLQKNKHNYIQAKLDTQQSEEDQNEDIIKIQTRNCVTSRRNNKIAQQFQCKSCKILKIDNNNSQIQSDFEQVKQKVQLLTDHIQNLQQRVQQNQRKYQLQLLQRDLRQKQKQIQFMQNQNIRMKQINDLVIMKEIKNEKNQNKFNYSKIFGSNPIVISFFMTLFVLLILSNLKNLMC